jgi:hypothetical protein
LFLKQCFGVNKVNILKFFQKISEPTALKRKVKMNVITRNTVAAYFDDADTFTTLLDDADSLSWDKDDDEFIAELIERFDAIGMSMAISEEEVARLKLIAQE